MTSQWNKHAGEHNESVTADTDILGSAISPVNTPTMVRIMACLSAAGVLKAMLTESGNTQTLELNEGSTLVADSVYIFDLVLLSGQTLNLQYSVNATARVLSVVEPAGGLL